MPQLLAVPKQGLTPRDPRTMLIVPPEGILVPQHNPYWQGLARFGDVELSEAEEPLEDETREPKPPAPASAKIKLSAGPVSASPASVE